jgi:hypothetical protein
MISLAAPVVAQKALTIGRATAKQIFASLITVKSLFL